MKIILDNTRHIKDGYGSSVVLCETKQSKNKDTGEFSEIESTIGYFPTVDKAVIECVRLASVQQTSNQTTLNEYLLTAKRIVQSLEIKGLNYEIQKD